MLWNGCVTGSKRLACNLRKGRAHTAKGHEVVVASKFVVGISATVCRRREQHKWQRPTRSLTTPTATWPSAIWTARSRSTGDAWSLIPDFFDGWHALGMALMKLGRFEEAIEAGKRAVELRPNDQIGWTSLSLFYNRTGNIKEAEAAGTKAKILSWGGKVAKE